MKKIKRNSSFRTSVALLTAEHSIYRTHQKYFGLITKAVGLPSLFQIKLHTKCHGNTTVRLNQHRVNYRTDTCETSFNIRS
jgi:hypothetical protein